MTSAEIAGSSKKSIYTQLEHALGGNSEAMSAIEDVVDHLYSRVAKDPALAPFFQGIDMTRMRNKLAALISVAFGSPHHIYEGQSLAAAHEGSRAKGLCAEHFNLFTSHLGAAMRHMGWPRDVEEQAMSSIHSRFHEVVKGEPSSAKTSGAATPH